MKMYSLTSERLEELKHGDEELTYYGDLVAEMASELLSLRQRVAETEWVKVSERLPENGKEVDILWVYDMDPTALFRGNTVKYPDETGIYVDDGDNDKTVVYWKYSYPLPPQESEAG
jgi:hypothetical protein